jgi:hypothetical protein
MRLVVLFVRILTIYGPGHRRYIVNCFHNGRLSEQTLVVPKRLGAELGMAGLLSRNMRLVWEILRLTWIVAKMKGMWRRQSRRQR